MQVRHDARYCALEAMPIRRKPHLFGRVVVDVYPWVKDRRYRTDVGNIYPTFKAALDGLVDAGVIADDNDDHVLAVTFHPCQYGVDQLELRIHGRD